MDIRFFVLATAAFLSGANLRVFDSLLPNIATEFHTSIATASLVVAAFTFAYGLFQIFYGPFGDRYGRIKTVSAATTIVAIGSLGSALAQDLEWLAALRFLSGIGAAGIIPVSLAWIGDQTKYAERQVNLGYFISFILMGQILGPALGGALAEFYSWRIIFYFFSITFFFMTAILIAVDHKCRSKYEAVKPSVTNDSPIQTYQKILKSSWCQTILIVVFFEGALFYGSFAFIGAWIKTELDLDYLTIGLLLSGFGFGGVIYTLSITRLQRVLGEKGFAMTGACLLFLFFVGVQFMNSTPSIGVWCVLGGFGFYILHNTLQTKATEMYPKARGTAISVFAMCLFGGQAVGTLAFGIMTSILGYSLSFMCAGVSLLMLGLFFVRKLNTQNRAH